LNTPEEVIEFIKCKTFQDLPFRIKESNVKDSVVTAVPDLVIDEDTRRLFFSHLDIQHVSNLLVGEGDKVFIAEKRNKAREEGDEKERDSDSIEANPPRFQSCDFTVARECAEHEKGTQEDCIRKSPFKGHFRDLIEEVFEDQVGRGLIFDKEIHFLKKENDNINEDQTTQAKAEKLQVFTNNILLDDPITIKHHQRALSISFEGY
jgi:hypothetical protein